MNTPPIFTLCMNDQAVTDALLDDGILRLYLFGMAPDGVKKPYAVWQLVSGDPINYMHGRPDTERHVLQIDVYADTASESRSVLASIEHAIELDSHIVRYGGESRDPETRNYRSTMDAEWHTYR